MDRLAEHINKCFTHLSRICVSGDAVDVMAAARQELRAAYQLAREIQPEEQSGEKSTEKEPA